MLNIRYWLWRYSKRIRGAFRTFQQLYKDVNGVILSRQDRKNYDSYELTYGEIQFYTLAAILDYIKPNKEDIFYDLGSGTGKAVIIASLLHRFKKCYGIECLPSLYQCAIEKQKKLKNSERIEFIKEDFLNTNISNGDVLYVNATGYFAESKQKLVNKLKQTKSQAWIIIVSKELPTSDFQLIDMKLWPMSWGNAMIYLYRRN